MRVMGRMAEGLSEAGRGTFEALQFPSNLNRTKRKQSKSCECERDGDVYRHPNTPCVLLAILLIRGIEAHPLSKLSNILSLQRHSCASTGLGQPVNQ